MRCDRDRDRARVVRETVTMKDSVMLSSPEGSSALSRLVSQVSCPEYFKGCIINFGAPHYPIFIEGPENYQDKLTRRERRRWNSDASFRLMGCSSPSQIRLSFLRLDFSSFSSW